MLRLGLVLQALDKHISQVNIEPVYYYLNDPQFMGNTQKTHDTKINQTQLNKWDFTLKKYGYH